MLEYSKKKKQITLCILASTQVTAHIPEGTIEKFLAADSVKRKCNGKATPKMS